MFTGRDIIFFILSNHLENEILVKDNKIPGFITTVEAAEKFDVGLATIQTWINNGYLKSVTFGADTFIPEDANPTRGGK